MSANTGRQVDEKTVQAMQACVDHARALLDSARAVRAAGHHNIAYHLATLVLEEIGRRELIAVQSLASQRPVPPAWPQRHTEDHIKKLFWCFFGGSSFTKRFPESGWRNSARLPKPFMPRASPVFTSIPPETF
jgi:AbiV family abortive infection protein